MNITTYTRVHKLTATQRLHISELESLALKPKRINELNDNYEMENLVDNIKQSMFQDYKSAYDNNVYPYPFKHANIFGKLDKRSS